HQDRPPFREIAPRGRSPRPARRSDLCRARDIAEPARRAVARNRCGGGALFRDGADLSSRGARMSALPRNAAIIVLGPGGAALGRRIRDLLPGVQLHGPRAYPGDWDESYERVVPHIATLFAAGTTIIGLCASGILIRAIAPLLGDKQAE